MVSLDPDEDIEEGRFVPLPIVKVQRPKPIVKVQRPKPIVLRITVDERLSDADIRILSAPLEPEGKLLEMELLVEDINCWGPEESIGISVDNFLSNLDIEENEIRLEKAVIEVVGPVKERTVSKNFLWDGLTEGMVFIIGNYEIKGERFAPVCLKVSREYTWDFLRVDRAERFKLANKKLYSTALSKDGVEKEEYL